MFNEAKQDNDLIIDNEPNKHRKLLPEKLFLTKDYDIFEWISYLRLISCSTKRNAKNIIDNKENKFTAENKSFSGFCLKFPNDNDNDIKLHFTNYDTTGSVTSHQQNIGAYTTINDTIFNIRDKFKINDVEIAKLVKDVLNNRNIERNEIFISLNSSLKYNIQSLVKYIDNLTVLMFLVEAHRNPSTLIVNHMILDLVENNKWSWEDALGKKETKEKSKKETKKESKNEEIEEPKNEGKDKAKISGKMPMSFVGATTASIWINEHYKNSINYKYDCREIIKKEAGLIKELVEKEARAVKRLVKIQES